MDWSNTHTLLIRKADRAECVCGVKYEHMQTIGNEQAKSELQVKGSHPLQLQVFLEKVESIKVSLYIVSLLLRLTLKILGRSDSGPVSVFKVQVQGIDVLDIKPLFSLIL